MFSFIKTTRTALCLVAGLSLAACLAEEPTEVELSEAELLELSEAELDELDELEAEGLIEIVIIEDAAEDEAETPDHDELAPPPAAPCDPPLPGPDYAAPEGATDTDTDTEDDMRPFGVATPELDPLPPVELDNPDEVTIHVIPLTD